MKITKHKGITENVGLVNEKMLRSSEMLLIMAEAKANTGNVSEANSLLNELRKNRITNYVETTYGTKEELLSQILLERRHELCFEGHRWFDLRRYNLPITKTAINKTLKPGDYHLLMPIPQSEMEANSTIAQQQNDGY